MAGTGAAVPSDQIADLKANAETLDQFVSSTGVSVVTRTGKNIKTIAGVEQDADKAVKSAGWFVVGNFADGFTFTAYNQVGRDSTGQMWSYNGSLPFTVAAGTVPSEPDYTNRGDAALRSDLTKDEVGKGIDIVENGFRKGIIQGEPAPIYGVTTVDHVDESTDRRVMGVIDNVLYACSGTAIYTSEDMGDTWTFLRSFSGRIQKILPCDDGEILYSNGGSTIYKSSGWAVNPTTATFSAVVDVTGAGVLRWGFDGDGTKFIATHYDSTTRANSRYAYISTDAGDTWSLVWDSAVQFPNDHTSTHLHAACYDPHNDRFFLNEGHLGLGMWYSNDNGATWSMIPDSDTLFPVSTPTTMTATPYGIVCGSDAFPDGVWLIKGDDASTLKLELVYLHRAATNSTTLQCDASVTDPETGMVYIAARGFSSPANSVIFASNGESAGIVFESDNNSPIYNLAVSQGKVFAEQGGTPYRSLKGRVSVIGSRPEKIVNNGNILTDNIVPNFSVAGGYESDAQGLRAISFGYEVKAGTVGGEDAIAFGRSITIESGQKNVAVGSNINLTGTTTRTVVIGSDLTITNRSGIASVGYSVTINGNNASVFGRSAIAGGSNSSVFGYQASSSAGLSTAIGYIANCGLEAVAVGSNSVASGTRSTGVGHLVNLTASNNTAMGHSATAGGSSCAFGYNASAGTQACAYGQGAVSSGVQSVAIGQLSKAQSTDTVAIGSAAETAVGVANAIALGSNAKGNHIGAVAIGNDSQTQRASSVCVGSRDIESTKAGGGIYLKSPNGTLHKITVSDAGALVVTVV